MNISTIPQVTEISEEEGRRLRQDIQIKKFNERIEVQRKAMEAHEATVKA